MSNGRPPPRRFIDGVDLVVVGPPAAMPAGTARALSSRARNRGCVLLSAAAWPGADLSLQLDVHRWRGLGQGHGRLRLREAVVSATGRGAAARPGRIEVELPPPSLAAAASYQPSPIPNYPRDVIYAAELPAGEPDAHALRAVPAHHVSPARHCDYVADRRRAS